MDKESMMAEKLKEAKEQATLPYQWVQTLTEVTITYPLPKGTRAKQLSISLEPLKIFAALKGSDPIIVGDLFAKTTDDSTWTIVDQQELQITLDKHNKLEWWPHVVTSAPKINTKLIDPENSQLSDLDGEARSTIEKMMFDQKQKQLGLPSSDELNKMQMFEKFKASHPELDFSQAKLE